MTHHVLTTISVSESIRKHCFLFAARLKHKLPPHWSRPQGGTETPVLIVSRGSPGHSWAPLQLPQLGFPSTALAFSSRPGS